MYRIIYTDMTVECETLEEVVSFLDEVKKRRDVQSDEWIIWNGGERPVNGDVMVDAKDRSGEKYENMRATDLEWSHDSDVLPSSNQIIAYRVVA